ncbi:hypothetical protein PAHAL_4G079300 [Panicum hallii]|uniref:Uncharacterized protein n=1 Tax=Panicum hallii TaxID=206008 RepID=A0A2T8JC95_9POAL|nr:hypothetical protein PAHAL_4G079300 [Panicum hallii]
MHPCLVAAGPCSRGTTQRKALPRTAQNGRESGGERQRERERNRKREKKERQQHRWYSSAAAATSERSPHQPPLLTFASQPRLPARWALLVLAR